MKLINWYLALALVPALVACFSDDTTEGVRPLSNIIIESGIDSIYNIDKNSTLVIEPVVVQENKEKPLTYTWEVNLEPYSADETFTFVGTTLGKYNCRLIVENEDGKSFFPFVVYVNSPYEEGITLLSHDSDGNSMLSFMQVPAPGEEASFTEGDCFALNNPDTPFAAGAVDVVQCSGNLIVACQGGGERGDLPTLYYLNEKTLVVENMFTVSEYDDFKPAILGVPLTGYSGTSYPIICENGNVYEFSTTESTVAKPRKLQSKYAQTCLVNSGNGYDILLWDEINKGLCQIYNGYGPYYCSTEYHLMLNDSMFVSKNYFNNRNLVAMAKVSMTPQQLTSSGGRQEFLIMTRLSTTPITRSEVLYTDFWGYDYEEMKPTFTTANTTQGALPVSPISVETPCVANKTFYSLLFANGNKVRRWNYNTNLSGLANAETLLTVGSDDAVITAFEISSDHLKTYVAFYEPGEEGLNGSVWVFDTDKGTVLEKYDNICYKPVKMFYKKK